MTGGTSPHPDDVTEARGRIADVARKTPLERSAALSERAGCDVLLKLECWQPTRSFKVRGALNAIRSLSPERLAAGVVTASAGNHGQAVALAARAAGVHATVFVPHGAPALKQRSIARLGAELRTDSATYDDAEEAARAFADDTGTVFVHAFSDPAVVAGQGTIALELLEECPDLREVIVPVGGGGLIGGIGSVLKTLRPATRVIGVQSTETRAMHAAFAAGHVVDVPVPPTLADGLAGRTDDASFQLARRVVDELLLVTEPQIAEAIRFLYDEDAVVAEGSGAVGVAVILSGGVRPRGPVAVIVTGGNIDAGLLAQTVGTGGRGTRIPL
ncbi:MAG TPA: threonine/serine dehydratase [Longimicrobiales bacterium]